MALNYVQSPSLYLAGSGVIAGATSITLTSLTDIYGNILTMTSFGTKGYITLEPNTTNAEAATFTGITANANGTYTLTGVSTALAQSPYTETSALIRNHQGGTAIVVTDNVAFWNTFTNKNNNETVTGQWTFTNTPIVPGTVSDASTTVKGVSKTSVAPASSTNPIVVGVNDIRVPIGYAIDSVGTDAYAISPAYVITSYVAGQEFTFKAGTANTGPATLNVASLGAITIKKNVSSDLSTGDILVGQILKVVYDGTNMQMVSPQSGEITSLPTPIFQQLLSGLITSQTSTPTCSATSSADGTVLFTMEFLSSYKLSRWALDTVTGAYKRTHTISATLGGGGTHPAALVVIGGFLYAFSTNTNIVSNRYSVTDLTGETAMTVPTVAAANVTAWTDGTSLYIIGSSSATTSRTWSLSGTTFTAVTTATCVSGLNNDSTTSLFDGTNIYIIDNSTIGTSTLIYKLANAQATSLTSTTTLFNGSGTGGGLLATLGTTGIYYGFWTAIFNATAQLATSISLIPITKP